MARKAVKTRIKGFTLSELLIALAILGVIATFTIPKVLQSQQDSKYKSIAKEVMGIVSESYIAYKLKNASSGSIGLSQLTPFMNYVRVDTSGNIDDAYSYGGTFGCSGSFPCIRLHNGAAIAWDTAQSFGGTATTNAIWLLLDPDGKSLDSTTNGPGKSMSIFLFHNGRIADAGSIPSNTEANNFTYGPDSGEVPPWFSWN